MNGTHNENGIEDNTHPKQISTNQCQGHVDHKENWTRKFPEQMTPDSGNLFFLFFDYFLTILTPQILFFDYFRATGPRAYCPRGVPQKKGPRRFGLQGGSCQQLWPKTQLGPLCAHSGQGTTSLYCKKGTSEVNANLVCLLFCPCWVLKHMEESWRTWNIERPILCMGEDVEAQKVYGPSQNVLLAPTHVCGLFHCLCHKCLYCKKNTSEVNAEHVCVEQCLDKNTFENVGVAMVGGGEVARTQGGGEREGERHQSEGSLGIVLGTLCLTMVDVWKFWGMNTHFGKFAEL